MYVYICQILFFSLAPIYPSSQREVSWSNMANSSNSSMVVFFFLVADGPSYDWENEFPPVSPPTSHFLNDCAKEVSQGCSKSYYWYIMIGDNGFPTTPMLSWNFERGSSLPHNLQTILLEYVPWNPTKPKLCQGGTKSGNSVILL